MRLFQVMIFSKVSSEKLANQISLALVVCSLFNTFRWNCASTNKCFPKTMLENYVHRKTMRRCLVDESEMTYL